jgi:uncharacterized Zn-binding protein involved in type VI secretion
MEIIGWIREGDQAACGGVVAEGDPHCISMGRAYSFQGARMACPKNCVIAEGYAYELLSNGRCQVNHGMKTSGGCPLVSTLNDCDGVGSERGVEIPIRFVQDDSGAWVGKKNEGYDQYFVLSDEKTGHPLPDRHYRITFKGRTIEGKTDAYGKTGKVTADDPAEVEIEVMPEGYTGTSR